MDDTFESWLQERPKDAVGGLAPGVRLGAYHVVARLAVGGFAEVYRVADEAGAPAAVKMLHRLDDSSLARFAREARILRAARHPNFPRLLGEGTFEGRPYLVMELLRPYVLPSTDRAVAAFLGRILAAVAALHAEGFVHRDIKPGNILQRPDGDPVLIDFGLAAPLSKALHEAEDLSVENGHRVAVGTAGHSAPEQFSGADVGPEADIHAIGMLVRDCFGGQLPFVWRRIYLTATNSNPQTRYPDAAAMARAIDRRQRPVALGVLQLVVVALGIAAAFLLGRSEPTPYTPAIYRQAQGTLTLASLNGYDFAEPVVVTLEPQGLSDAGPRYRLKCTICFRDRFARADEADPMSRINARGKMLNDWLKAFVAEHFAHQNSARLRRRVLSGQLANDLSNGFINDKTYQKWFREKGLEVVAVTVEPVDALRPKKQIKR